MPSPTFLTLPPEIRLIIYTYAISSVPTTAYQEPLECPPIILACRQTYQEAEGLHYSRFCVRVRINRDGLLWYQVKSNLHWKRLKDFSNHKYPAILRNYRTLMIQLNGFSTHAQPGESEYLEETASPTDILRLLKYLLATLKIRKLYVCYSNPFLVDENIEWMREMAQQMQLERSMHTPELRGFIEIDLQDWNTRIQ